MQLTASASGSETFKLACMDVFFVKHMGFLPPFEQECYIEEAGNLFANGGIVDEYHTAE